MCLLSLGRTSQGSTGAASPGRRGWVPAAQPCLRSNPVPSRWGSLGEPQCRDPRARSPSARGRHRVLASGRPGLATSPARRERRGCSLPSRPPSNPLCSATRGRAGGGSLRGHPGYCSGPRPRPISGRSGLSPLVPTPRAALGSAAGRAGRLRADGELARTEKSCSEGRRRWVVGGGGGWGRRSPSYLQSRKYSAAQLTEPGDEAASAASRAPVCAPEASRGTERPPGRRSLRAGTSAPRGWARRLLPGLATSSRRRTRPWAPALASARTHPSVGRGHLLAPHSFLSHPSFVARCMRSSPPRSHSSFLPASPPLAYPCASSAARLVGSPCSQRLID